MRSFRLLLAAALICACPAAPAHNFHAGIVDISYNARSGSTEIVHTYMSHDVDALLGNLYQREFDLTQPEDEQVLRNYVEARFRLLGADGKPLALRWIGIKVEIEGIVVYQEAEHTPLDSIAAIRDEVLTDFLPDQIDTVNVALPGGPRTYTFSRQVHQLPLR